MTEQQTIKTVETTRCVDCDRELPGLATARPGSGLPAVTRCTDCQRRRRLARNAANLTAQQTGAPPAPRNRAPEGGDAPFHALCAVCGARFRMAFPSSPDRPVYCHACFDARSG